MITIPETPGTLAYEGGWDPDGGRQSPQMLHTTLTQIKLYEDEIESELSPPVTVTILPTNRVLLDNGQYQMLAYMSDQHADARLLLDDYIPEDEYKEPKQP